VPWYLRVCCDHIVFFVVTASTSLSLEASTAVTLRPMYNVVVLVLPLYFGLSNIIHALYLH